MRTLAVAALIIVGFLAFRVTAQETGVVTGVVKDTAGAVLPGVTVRVVSVELLGRVRTTITDAGGRYRVVNLPAGIYTVSFSLAGFSPVVRVGVEVPARLTTSVDADMKVGTADSASGVPAPRRLGSMRPDQMRPHVRCGLTIVPADPKLDAKILVPYGRAQSGPRARTGGEARLSVANRPHHTMPAIAPTVCGDR
jgi:hypothetical protein